MADGLTTNPSTANSASVFYPFIVLVVTNARRLATDNLLMILAIFIKKGTGRQLMLLVVLVEDTDWYDAHTD